MRNPINFEVTILDSKGKECFAKVTSQLCTVQETGCKGYRTPLFKMMMTIMMSHEEITRRVKHVSLTMSKFWKRWKDEYLTGLRESHHLMQVPGSDGKFVAIGDLVLVHDEKQPRLLWRMSKVENLIKGEDNIIRGAVIRVQSGGRTTNLKRPVQKLYPLELNLNTKTIRNEDDAVQHSESQVGDSGQPMKHPKRVAAQVARYQWREWMDDDEDSSLQVD